MKISIIISTYSIDRYGDLVDLLESIKIQTYKDIEIIIIIDKDRELYNKIERIACDKYKNIKTVFNPKNRGLSYSRNVGIKCATGDIITFIDDDAIPVPKWAEVIVNTFDSDDVGAVTGDIIPLWEHEDMSWFPKELHWMISCSYIMTPSSKCEIERGFGTNMSFRSNLIDKIGMFNTNLGINGRKWVGGEDTDMFLRVRDSGKKIIFDPDVRVLHKICVHRVGIRNIMKRAFDGGVSLVYMSNIRSYDVKKSTEKDYLKKLIFKFYPKKFKMLISKPSDSLRQMISVTIVIITQGTGYLYGKFDRNKR
jgi:glycosyltransferase involved in cell wall biosynthesis